MSSSRSRPVCCLILRPPCRLFLGFEFDVEIHHGNFVARLSAESLVNEVLEQINLFGRFAEQRVLAHRGELGVNLFARNFFGSGYIR